MASVKSFCGKRTQHRFLSDAVRQIENDDSDSADVVMIGPPTGGHDSDMENEDEDVLKTTGLPDKVAGKLKSSISEMRTLREFPMTDTILWHLNRNKQNKPPKKPR